MSLDCYPLTRAKTIGLSEQPIALDVAYEENLLITVVDGCQTIAVYQLESEEQQVEPLAKFSLGSDVVIDRVVYGKTGDYIACVGHRNGKMGLHVVLDWRTADSVRTEHLDLLEMTASIDETDRHDKLECIDVCQRTGNIAASYGDLVVIYQLNMSSEAELSDDSIEKIGPSTQFTHIISVKVTIWAHAISLVENYLSISTGDHVQVIKLELLTLQIQSDGQNDPNGQLSPTQNQANRSGSGSSGDSRNPGIKSHRSASAAAASRTRRAALLGSAGDDSPNGTTSTVTASSSGDTDSLLSGSNNSTITNFSAFNTTGTTLTEVGDETAGDLPAQPANTPDCSDGELEAGPTAEQQVNNDSDMSIITMNNLDYARPSEDPDNTHQTAHQGDDCITWNLNTKKLVKLPTLMHNTSTDLSSYHICHPLELLGPASESIACRVLARLYSTHFCQNQLEPVVLLCKQFDSDHDPIKSTHLEPIYLASSEDQRRLGRTGHGTGEPASTSEPTSAFATDQHQHSLLLKSADHELLASVTCFVATLTNCFVYALHGKKAVRLQTITHPDLCLDFRPDLLNVYLLTPLGLQICSTGLCDATFRYDWSSSADLNLSFLACNRARVLATAKYIAMVSCSPPSPSLRHGANHSQPDCCFIELWRKPSLADLFKRVVHIIKRCQSISIRSNLLTYLHARAQLNLIGSQLERSPVVEMLKSITIMLCKQLLQKKQTNVITNSRIDRVIKHLLDISYCDLRELMTRHLEQLKQQVDITVERAESNINILESCEDDDPFAEDEPLDKDLELLTIFLRHTKYNPQILAYLQANSTNESICMRIISYMFEQNPRLLIKCAQRFAMDNCLPSDDQMTCLNLLVARLKQLTELDSTGINRATVLFTLANLYNAMGGQRQLALATLSQIKPLSHLAITMCSNYEIIGRPMAQLVAENYAKVFRLFLNQLTKRDANASLEFAKILEISTETDTKDIHEGVETRHAASKLQLFGSHSECVEDHEQPGEEDLFERCLMLVAEMDPTELADIFLEQKISNKTGDACEDDATVKAYLHASIGLLESQFILARLCESSH